MKECPHCGSEEYYVKQNLKGNCEYVLRFDGGDAENGHIHDNITYKNTSKFAWCNECHKRLFELNI